ncbi:MAG: hypothetical protein LUE29_04125, partial [Lachnospiraceae bacterium]|nr:hypothetical protein [Lachnospiraceae bacterium]
MKSGFLENLRTRIGGQRKKWGGKKRADSPDTETQKMKSEAAKMPQAYARRDHTEVQKIKGESSDLAAEETGKTEKVGKKATEGNQTVLSEISKGESKAEMEEKKSTDFFGGDMEEEQDVLFEDGELADPEPEAPTEEAEFEVGRAEEKQPPEIEVTEIKSEETETAEPEPEETETAEP